MVVEMGAERQPRAAPAASPAVKRTLVVGGGFIGLSLVRELLWRGYPTTLLTRTVHGNDLSTARLIQGDTSDNAVWEDALADTERVVWCAGGLLPAEANQRPIEHLLAVQAPLLTMLERLKDAPGSSVIYFSSGGAVYGDSAEHPIGECAPLKPRSMHGIASLTCEQLLARYRDIFGLRTLALRCGNVYGYGQQAGRSQGLVASALQAIRTDTPLPIYGDGLAVRDYVHVDDVVDVVIYLSSFADWPPAINVGSGIGMTVLEVLNAVEQVVGRPVPIEFRPHRIGEVYGIVLDISLLRSLTTFEPLSLVDGLTKTYRHLEETRSSPAGVTCD